MGFVYCVDFWIVFDVGCVVVFYGYYYVYLNEDEFGFVGFDLVDDFYLDVDCFYFYVGFVFGWFGDLLGLE